MFAGNLNLKKLLRWAIYFLIGTMSKGIIAQPAYENSKYYSYEQVMNPAATGRDRYPFFNFSSKKYWIGTPDSPFEVCMGGAFRLGRYNFYKPNMLLNKGSFTSRERMGGGGFMMFDQNGPLQYLVGELEYAYHLPLDASGTTELSLGLALNISNYNINTNLLDPLDPGDLVLANLNKQKPLLDGGFGIYFNTEQLFVGSSVKNILGTKMFPNDPQKGTKDYFVNGGYKFFLHYFDLEPSMVIAYAEGTPFYSSQIKAYYRDYNWLSLSYMSTNTIRLALGFRVGRIHVAYAFEQSVSKMANYFSNSHELMLGLNIGLFEPAGLRKTIKRRR